MIRKYRHLGGKDKISKFPQVGKMSTDSNILHTSVCVRVGSDWVGCHTDQWVNKVLRHELQLYIVSWLLVLVSQCHWLQWFFDDIIGLTLLSWNNMAIKCIIGTARIVCDRVCVGTVSVHLSVCPSICLSQLSTAAAACSGSAAGRRYPSIAAQLASNSATAA